MEPLKYKKCRWTLNGALFILKENMSILDTWNSIVLGEDIECDLCVGENSWILHPYLMLEKNKTLGTTIEDLPDRTVNYISLNQWQKLLRKHKNPSCFRSSFPGSTVKPVEREFGEYYSWT